MSSHSHSLIELHQVGQSFVTHQHSVSLFADLTFSIEQGHSYAITGPSGSGKSSLLMLASGLEQPTAGEVVYSNQGHIQPISHIRSEIGFIFQQFHLLPEFDALNNVALPLKLRGHKQALAIAKEWLDKVGLGHRLKHKPAELSGGEQQRVAIARALVFNPKFIFADEPTGNLDANSAGEIADLLFECCRDKGAGLVLVTHSDSLAQQTQHQLRFNAGKCERVSAQQRAEHTVERGSKRYA
ncbi:ABC transporter ATP-binding protein [Alteromonas sp. ASW11-36]|uniref:ABC transporter ATP-binding protein n=1 Tax=Alteromonas arenosi TaxID=3055817 RepID=A0ABT7SW41_9ALTE|nr:ABC transporter ATP-binding protein [Alteromonas sp. ASW11-36]MDM7860413.1 ABC transporter ATP-binding protein [Alteromonas sp. ASW11-36]